MLSWLRAGTFSWQKLQNKMHNKYSDKGAAAANTIQKAHRQINRRLAKPQNFPIGLLELSIGEWINFRELPPDLFEKLDKPAHVPLLYLINSRSRSSDRFYGTRSAEKRLKDKPDARDLEGILQTTYFPYLDQQFKESISCHKLPQAVVSLLLENLNALMLGIAWFALMEEENRTIQEILAYWQEGNFILSLDGPMRSASMLALPVDDKK